MVSANTCYAVFNNSITDYHKANDVDFPIRNPYSEKDFEHLLYLKNWIDTVQWHLEDIIRDPAINPVKGLEIKRRIDQSNQHRTDVVEKIDDQILLQLKGSTPLAEARLNSETPAWLLDRMSILVLKIYHMKEQTERTDATAEHLEKCKTRLAILMEQQQDMRQCFDELIEDVRNGKRKVKVYRQMKMYNDAAMNPVLYANKK